MLIGLGILLSDPRVWIYGYGAIDFINGAVSANPPETLLQGFGYTTKEFIIDH